MLSMVESSLFSQLFLSYFFFRVFVGRSVGRELWRIDDDFTKNYFDTDTYYIEWVERHAHKSRMNKSVRVVVDCLLGDRSAATSRTIPSHTTLCRDIKRNATLELAKKGYLYLLPCFKDGLL